MVIHNHDMKSSLIAFIYTHSHILYFTILYCTRRFRSRLKSVLELNMTFMQSCFLELQGVRFTNIQAKAKNLQDRILNETSINLHV